MNNKTQCICIIYRHPSTAFDCFSNEFTDFLEKCFSKQTPFIILGDFNFHADDADNALANKFRLLLETFSLQQHVTEPTHIAGHVLDLIITPENCPVAISTSSVDDLISDHFVVTCRISEQQTAEHCKSLNNFFITKIDNICKDFTDTPECYDYDNCSVDNILTQFTPLPLDEIANLVKNSSSKTCDLIPLPTKFSQTMSQTYPNHYQRFTARSPCSSLFQAGNCYTYFKKT